MKIKERQGFKHFLTLFVFLPSMSEQGPTGPARPQGLPVSNQYPAKRPPLRLGLHSKPLGWLMELFSPLGPSLHRSQRVTFCSWAANTSLLPTLSPHMFLISVHFLFCVCLPSSIPPVPPPSCHPSSSIFHPLQGMPGFPGVLGRPVGFLLLAGMLELWGGRAGKMFLCVGNAPRRQRYLQYVLQLRQEVDAFALNNRRQVTKSSGCTHCHVPSRPILPLSKLFVLEIYFWELQSGIRFRP